MWTDVKRRSKLKTHNICYALNKYKIIGYFMQLLCLTMLQHDLG